MSPKSPDSSSPGARRSVVSTCIRALIMCTHVYMRCVYTRSTCPFRLHRALVHSPLCICNVCQLRVLGVCEDFSLLLCNNVCACWAPRGRHNINPLGMPVDTPTPRFHVGVLRIIGGKYTGDMK